MPNAPGAQELDPFEDPNVSAFIRIPRGKDKTSANKRYKRELTQMAPKKYTVSISPKPMTAEDKRKFLRSLLRTFGPSMRLDELAEKFGVTVPVPD